MIEAPSGAQAADDRRDTPRRRTPDAAGPARPPSQTEPGPRPRTRRVRRRTLRPARFDDLGLKRALSDRLLPLLVAAMAFLAALALSGAVAAAALARHWQEGAGTVLTVQVPQPARPAAKAGGDAGGGRAATVLAALRGTSGVAGARLLDAAELDELLRPWLGTGEGRVALPLPAVIEVRLAGQAVPAGLAERLDALAPGTLVEGHEAWMARLGALARSLQACAGLATAVVAGVSAAVIAVATRAGLASRRDAIEIVHGLGATDSYIAGRFARRATALAAAGAALGAAAALPVLLGLARLAEPFAAGGRPDAAWGAVSALPALPGPVWAALPLLPAAAAAIGWVTAQGTVRRWLRRLP